MILWRMDEQSVHDMDLVTTYVYAYCGELDDDDPRRLAAIRLRDRLDSLSKETAIK